MAIIGIDGAGKSTQVALLVEALNRWRAGSVLAVKGNGANSEVFKLLNEANGCRVHPDIKCSGYTLDFVARYIELERNASKEAILVWDRYSYCIEAYFLPLGVNMGRFSPILSLLPEPLAVFLLDLDPKVAIRRLKSRGEKGLKPEENLRYLSSVCEQYRTLANKTNIILLDASEPCSQVHKRIWQYLGDLGIGREVS